MSTSNERGIPFDTLTITLIAMTIFLILALIKIYLSNQIYYESRRIHTLEQDVAALKEEKTLLKMRVEKLQYKSQITDTIFALDDTPPPKDTPDDP